MRPYPRRTTPTVDPDGTAFNALHNQILHRISCGEMLHDLLANRFAGDWAMFRAWTRCNLDVSLDSIKRYLCLYEHREMLAASGMTSLRDAYSLLGLTARAEE